jgi:hypothetical protein
VQTKQKLSHCLKCWPIDGRDGLQLGKRGAIVDWATSSTDPGSCTERYRLDRRTSRKAVEMYQTRARNVSGSRAQGNKTVSGGCWPKEQIMDCGRTKESQVNELNDGRSALRRAIAFCLGIAESSEREGEIPRLTAAADNPKFGL